MILWILTVICKTGSLAYGAGALLEIFFAVCPLSYLVVKRFWNYDYGGYCLECGNDCGNEIPHSFILCSLSLIIYFGNILTFSQKNPGNLHSLVQIIKKFKLMFSVHCSTQPRRIFSPNLILQKDTCDRTRDYRHLAVFTPLDNPTFCHPCIIWNFPVFLY